MDIYSFIPVSRCVGMGSSALLCPGPIMLLRRPWLSVLIILKNIPGGAHPGKDWVNEVKSVLYE